MCKCRESYEKEMMHHIIIEKLECLHKEVTELKEKMCFVGLKMKFMKEHSCQAFEKMDGKLDCLKGMMHHEMEELEEGLEDLYTCSAMAQETCECPECKEHEESPAKK